MQAIVIVVEHNTLSSGALQICEVLSQYLKQLWSHRAEKICDRQTDGRTDRQMVRETYAWGKTICL